MPLQRFEPLNERAREKFLFQLSKNKNKWRNENTICTINRASFRRLFSMKCVRTNTQSTVHTFNVIDNDTDIENGREREMGGRESEMLQRESRRRDVENSI